MKRGTQNAWIVVAFDGIYDHDPLAVFDDEISARTYAESPEAMADGKRALAVESPPQGIFVEGPFPFRHAERSDALYLAIHDMLVARLLSGQDSREFLTAINRVIEIHDEIAEDYADTEGAEVDAPTTDHFVPMHNTQTNATGRLTIEDSESRFNYMIVTDGGGPEEGYWQAHEWQRNGWTEVEPEEPDA